MRCGRANWVRSALLIMMALAVLVGPRPVHAQADGDYIFDILKRRPAMLKSWRWIVPQKYAGQAWIKSLEGTSGPVDRVIVGGKPFVLGSACWPHNCGGNFVAFLIAADGSEAYGMLRSSDLRAQDEAFGSPDETKRRMLTEVLSR